MTATKESPKADTTPLSMRYWKEPRFVSTPIISATTGFKVVNEALQLHGGYGYLRDYPIERYFRDVRVHQILEGTNEIMHLIVSRQLIADRG